RAGLRGVRLQRPSDLPLPRGRSARIPRRISRRWRGRRIDRKSDSSRARPSRETRRTNEACRCVSYEILPVLSKETLWDVVAVVAKTLAASAYVSGKKQGPC